MQVKSRIKEITKVKASEILPNPKNWRMHPEEQKNAMMGAFAEIGNIDVLKVFETPKGLMLVDGHLRTDILGDNEVEVAILDLTQEEADKALLTFDPIAIAAAADEKKLAELMDAIDLESKALADILEGIEIPESKGGSGEVVKVEPQMSKADELKEKWGTAEGQLWLIEGNQEHRLLCGDSTRADNVDRLMGGEKAVLVHADPPYGMGKEKDGVENDNLYDDKLDSFQMEWWKAFRPHVEDNGSAYIWGNAEELWRLWYGSLKKSERLTLRNEIVWDKKNDSGKYDGNGIGSSIGRQYAQIAERCLFFMLGEQGFNNNADNYWEGWEPIRLYLETEMNKVGGSKKWKEALGNQMGGHYFTRSQWSFPTEDAYKKLQAFAKGDAFKREHDDLKREFYSTRAYFDNTHDNMTDVWEFKRVTGEDRHGHATPKPVEMMGRCIKSSCPDGGLVVEPFGGSGTTMLAAEQLNRKCYGMEISPAYTAVILQRMTDAGCKCKLSE